MFAYSKRNTWTLVSCVALLTLGACGGGGGSSSPGGSGTVGISLTDAPSCGYSHVFITVSKVRIHQSADPNVADADPGWTDIALPSPARIDLVGLTNGVLTSLGTTPLAAGTYQQIRLVLFGNTGNSAPFAESVVLSGTTAEIALQTPSGMQSGIKLIHGFTVSANTLVDVVLDFDACHSIVSAGNSGMYLLKPVVTVNPMIVSGEIDGWVNPAVAASTQVIVTAQVFDVATAGLTVAKSTVADPTTGKFVLSPVLASDLQAANYQVVVTANGYATEQISGVSVAASSVVNLNTPSTPITFTPSQTGTASGSVTIATSTTGVSATVNALQAFPGGVQAQIGFANVYSSTTSGSYSITLPVAAAQAATFVAGTPLAFTSVLTSAGAYSLLADAVTSAGTQRSSPAAITVTSGGTTTQNFSF